MTESFDELSGRSWRTLYQQGRNYAQKSVGDPHFYAHKNAPCWLQLLEGEERTTWFKLTVYIVDCYECHHQRVAPVVFWAGAQIEDWELKSFCSGPEFTELCTLSKFPGRHHLPLHR